MKRIKNIIAIIGITNAFILTPLSSYAGTYTNGETSGSIAVTAVVSSTYSITLPAELQLTPAENDITAYSGSYEVGVKANLLDNEKITVIPVDSFTMTDGIHDVTASIEQPVQTWRNSISDPSSEVEANYTEYIYTTGTISAILTNAGSYSGMASFVFAKETD